MVAAHFMHDRNKKDHSDCAVFGINVYGKTAKQGFIKNVNIYP